ncbi:MAG: AtpZ/AtpI family protein [Arachidicoccus sp.]|nr:AtpZ/AtpI family protein [Arachidicoccus sp.]
MEDNEQKSNNYMLYMNYGFQLLGGVAIGIFAGKWIDKKMNLKTPLLIWIIPLLILVALLYRLVKEFSGKRKDKG